jgi:hypothetical protein
VAAKDRLVRSGHGHAVAAKRFELSADILQSAYTAGVCMLAEVAGLGVCRHLAQGHPLAATCDEERDVRPPDRTGALYLLCAVLGLVSMIRGSIPSRTRPRLVAGVFVVVHLLRDRRRLPEMLGLAAEGELLLLAYFAYNPYVMGSPLGTPYTLSNTACLGNLGFSGHLTVERAPSNVYTRLTLLDVVLFAWPAGVALLLVLFPFVLGSMNRWDYVLGGLALGIVVAWLFNIDSFIMYGPRLRYEMALLLVLLTTRGISVGVLRARSLACALGRGDRSDWIVQPVAARWRPRRWFCSVF